MKNFAIKIDCIERDFYRIPDWNRYRTATEKSAQEKQTI